MVTAGLAGTWYAITRPAKRPVFRGHVMDRRCRGGCSTAAAVSPVYAFEVFWGGTGGQIGGGAVSTQAGTPLTLARASTTLCGDVSGGFSNSVSSGTACTELQGLAVRPLTGNIITQSNDMTAWTLDGTTRVQGATCPDGTTNGVTVFDTTSNAAHRTYQGLGGNNQGVGFYNFSIYAKPDPTHGLSFVTMKVGSGAEQAVFDIAHGTVALAASNYAGYSAANVAFNIVPSSNGFYRLSFASNDTTGAGFAMLYLGDTYNDVQGSYAGATPSNGVVFCNPMVTAGHLEDTRAYVQNTAASGVATRAADLFSVANPLTTHITTLTATVTPDNWRYDAFIERGLIGLGWDAGNDSDSARWFVSDGGFMTWVVTDTNGLQDTWVSNTIIWPGRRHLRLVDNAGSVTMYQDGALDGGLMQLATTHSGANGNGYITTPPSTIFVGSEGSYGNQFGGVMQDICGDITTAGCAFQFTKHHLSPLYTTKTLLALGDSLTRNTLANSTYWPAMFANDVPGWTVNNWGEPAYTIAQIDQKYSDAGWYATPQQFTTLEEGINDSISQLYTDAVEQFWKKQLWDKISASGSTLIVLRESPYRFSASWSSGEQTHFNTNQDWVLTEAALYGYPFKDFYGNDGGLIDAGAAGASSLLCQFDYDTDGTAVKCPDGSGGGTVEPNWVHTNDAGQGVKESNIRGLLGL